MKEGKIMGTKFIIFLFVFGLIFTNLKLGWGQEQFVNKQGTTSYTVKDDLAKKELLNDWVTKITKKIDAQQIDFETDKPKEVIAIIGLRGWELQVKRFDLPNWLGEIATSKDKFLLGLDYAKKENMKSAFIIFESFIKNFPDSKAKVEAEKAIEILKGEITYGVK